MMPPTSLSPLAEMVPTCAISSLVVTFFDLRLERVDDFLDRQVDAALQVHRIGAGGDRLGAFPDDRLGENSRRRGAVAGDITGLRGDLAQHLRAHVLELVLELDLLGDRHSVLGDAGGAEALLDDDVATLGAERDTYGIGEDIDAAQHLFAGLDREFHVLCGHDWLLQIDWFVGWIRRRP